MKINLIFVFICCLFMSCGQRNIGWDKGMQNIFSFADNVFQSSQSRIKGFGGAMPEGRFSYLFASFDREENIEIEKARILIVELAEEFLNNINQDNQLKPYLSHFPFDYSNVKVGLSFFTKDGDFVGNNHIAYVLLVNGKLDFAVHNEKTQKLETIAQEPYLEALQKVKNTNEENLLSVPNPT